MTKPDAIATGIEKALDLNLKLQSDIRSKLRQIATLKQNLSVSLCRYNFDESACDERLQEVTINDDSAHRNKTNIDTTIHLHGNEHKNGKKNKKRKKPTATSKHRPAKNVRGWRFKSDRKWTRRFFLDPYQSTPKPNPETIQRRQWEGDLVGEGSYRYSPWSKQELELLLACAEERRQQQATDEMKQVKDADINFHEVMKLIKQELSKRKLTPSQIRKIQSNSYSSCDQAKHDTIQLRLYEDYRNKFLTTLSPSINKTPFTKVESSKILDFVRRYDDNPPWSTIAQSLNNSRTPFQCFRHVQIKMNNNVATLNEHEDELLFKFIAASGPQLVLNHHTATYLSQQFFPHLSTGQVLIRANTSFHVNPNYRSERWSETEERILVLGMRAYCDDDFSVSKVASLLPNRSLKLVMDKWNRSLNPQYNTQPFTWKEDEQLLSAVKRTKAQSRNWKVIASLFPSRKPWSLLSRFTELTKNNRTSTFEVEEEKCPEESDLENQCTITPIPI
mmetsp:Transcript_7527/g.11485  ORF Transcript_7527/g.11485 Transcript_7527/m.11485 type:complete len:504 (+) Transcript_7527:139-1650(+)